MLPVSSLHAAPYNPRRIKASSLFARGSRSEAAHRKHPNQKPVALLADIMSRHTKRGDLVADPYAGVGSVMMACERLGRRCLSMEIDPRYVDVAIARYRAASGGA